MTITTRALTVVSALALSAVAIVTVSAQQAQTPGRGPRGMGPGRGGPGGPMPMFQQLGLTDAQREQIKSLATESNGKENRQALGTLQHDLTAAIMADSPDLNKIDQIKASISEAEAAALSARVDLELKIAQQVLTPEQRQKALQLPAGPPGRGGRGF